MNNIDFANQIKENFNELGLYLTNELTEELINQGHKYTGSMIKSISFAISFYQNELVLSFSYFQYGAYLNNGIKANRVPYGRGGGKKSEYLQGLMNWVIGKRIETNAKKAFGIAIAIAKTHAKNGIPTVGSYKYSLNGRRVGFQDYVLATKSVQINEIIQTDLEQAVFNTLDNLLQKTA
jgi:hypothetical protein